MKTATSKSMAAHAWTTELQVEHGLSCSENRVARLMAKNGLQARYKAAFRPKTTTQDPTQKASPNILANTEASFRTRPSLCQ